MWMPLNDNLIVPHAGVISNNHYMKVAKCVVLYQSKKRNVVVTRGLLF